MFIAGRCARTILSQRRVLARAAVRAGFAVVTAGEDTDAGESGRQLEAETIAYRPIQVRQASMNPLALMALVFRYRRLLMAESPDIFHAFTIKPVIAGLIAARLSNIKVRIATIPGLGHGFICKNYFTQFVVRILYRFSLSFAHKVYFYNIEDYTLFTKSNIVSCNKCIIINGSGVDTCYFTANTYNNNICTKFRFLYVGRIIREKGISELFEVANLLQSRAPDIRIELVGDFDPNNPSSLTAAEVDRARALGNVRFHGPVNDVRPFIANADAVVLPSYREGIPLALLEAAAMGKPAVATDVPGCKDVVVAGKTGFLCTPRDAAALAEAMVLLASDRERAREMGMAAREDVLLRFSAEVVSAKMIDDYRALLETQSAAFVA